MKKIAFVAFLLAVCAAAGRAQESRQDISLSGTGLIQPFISSSTDVQVSAQRGFGALASYRFQLTPSSALEANYGLTYQYKSHYIFSNTNNYLINSRTQEVSFAYVRSFTYRKFNPFLEAGPGIFIYVPVRDQTTQTLDAKQQSGIGFLYGVGIAYELSPSFDIRAEYRGFVTKVPSFGVTTPPLDPKRFYNIYIPTVGVAYHF
ncbi:MAG TPA: outer membrane beta-barrel protein [Terracidiphilus sp.]|jgi:opacity protein-like surface antigen|nr:outer membrane beta-barrel protein [Terracidiphilus sp.]